jgi:hypothetical protein
MKNKTGTSFYIIIAFLLPNLIFSAITKGPYLTVPKANSMTIMWESDSNVPSKVIYWQSEDEKLVKKINSFDSNDSLFLYSATLDNLKESQKYFYKVVAGNDSSESYFYTNPKKGEPFTFVAIGDSRSNHDVFSAIANDVNKLSPRLVINMGDLLARGYEFKQWNPHFFDPAKSVINHIPHISTLGDHETSGGYSGYSFYYYFRNGVSVDKMWFSYDFGDVHFVSLDYRGESNEEMIEWFKNDVSQSDAKWKIVYLHRPMYNLGGHRAHWGKQIWQELYRENKIDIVFAGHSHVYERFYPMRPSTVKDAWPVTFITTGGAGAGLYEAVQNECAAVSKSVNHYNIISLSNDTLKLKSLLLDGTVLDQFEIVKENGKYSDSYLSLVKPQEVMDVYMAFANKLRIKFDSIPTKEIASKHSIKFRGAGLPSDIPFKVELSKESSKYYRIEPLKGILKKGENYKGTVVLYAKDKVEQRRNFLDPPLFFNVIYNYKGKSYTAYGAESRNTLPYK